MYAKSWFLLQSLRSWKNTHQVWRDAGLLHLWTKGYEILDDSEPSCGQFVPCCYTEDRMVSYHNRSCGGWFEAAGLGTQRQPQSCVPTFLIIYVTSCILFYILTHKCVCLQNICVYMYVSIS